MLGVASGDGASAQLPSQILSDLAQLRVNSEVYERFIAQESGAK
jgi:hypothetical protein